MSEVEPWQVRFALTVPEARSAWVLEIREALATLAWWERWLIHIWVGGQGRYHGEM